MRRDGQPPDPELLGAMADALAHRGPDGSGTYFGADIGMVQTRLAIIDLLSGDQPLSNTLGQALVANGEIYNYRLLRDLIDPSQLRTASDCELPLAIYAEQQEAG